MDPRPESPIWQRDSSHAQVLDYHMSMLFDAARMDAFRRAIHVAVHPGDVVVDVGCGTGVLSFMACDAGAARVYAIEGGPIIETARELAVANGYADRIVFLDSWSIDVELPEQADVLITETIGSAGLDEGIIAWAYDARNRFLKPGAAMLPEQLRLWLAPVDAAEEYALVEDWLAPELPYDYSKAHARAARSLWFTHIDPTTFLGPPELAADIDFPSVANERWHASGHLTIERDGTFHGFGCWFDSLLTAKTTVDNTPGTSESSWSQGFLPLPEPIVVSAGDVLGWELSISPDGHHWRWAVESR